MRGRARMKPFRRPSRKGSVLHFSVIIPTCNRPQFLAEAVASVLAQQNADFELLIANDGDALAALPQDPRIRHLENARRGAVSARNLAVAAARGHAIAWLDDDDQWIDPHHLAHAAATLTAGAAFTFGDGVMRYEDGSADRAFARDATAASLAQDNTILISAVTYTRTLHQRLGLFDAALPYYWDWDWYLRVARSGAPLQRIAKPVVAIRVHTANMSGEAQKQARQDNLAALAHKHGLGELRLKNHTDFV
jgi:glycosyltransferase involved in cell wall biosynthesis